MSERTASTYSVYLIRCANGDLYAGVATNVERRLKEHVAGGRRGARFLRGKGPLSLVFAQEIGDRCAAMRVEYRLKKLSRLQKKRLIAGQHTLTELLPDIGIPSAQASGAGRE